MNGKRAMRRLALCALAGVLALGATIQNGYAQQALAIDPSNPATLYAAEYGGGVFKSINGGASWTASSSGLTNLGVLALVVDPSNPATLYAGTTKGGVLLGDDNSRPGSANCGVLKKLIDSARNVTRFSVRSVQVRESDAFTL